MWALALGVLAPTLANEAFAQASVRATLSRTADSLVLPAIQAKQLAGATLIVVRAADTLLFRTYGAADLELGAATPVDAVYRIGSLTKQFTAAAVLQLADEGKLRLDEDIRDFLPEYPTHGASITVEELLTHTSGIFDYVSLNGIRRRWEAPIPAESLLALIGAHALNFPPGSAMSYSNSGYFLLGRIIERVSGMSYQAYIADHILQPAGLSGVADAVRCDPTSIIPHRVHGYDLVESGMVNAEIVDASWLSSAGSLCMSARDLVRWSTALAHGAVIRPQAYAVMTTPGVLSGGFTLRYAAGLEVDSLLGYRAVHHGGDLPGFTSELTYLPDQDLTVVVLMNTQGPLRPDAVTLALLHAVLRNGGSTLPTAGCPSGPEEYAGTYVGARPFRESVATRTFQVSAESPECQLMLRIDGGLPLLLRAGGPDEFSRLDTRFAFRRVHGRIVGLYVDNVTDVVYATRSVP